MIIPLKAKYRTGKVYKRTPYRTRTGPRCCTPNCPAKAKNRTKPQFGGFRP